MSSHTDTRPAYYTEPCACGANPTVHIGHTQACADAHRAAQATRPVSLIGLPIAHRR